MTKPIIATVQHVQAIEQCSYNTARARMKRLKERLGKPVVKFVDLVRHYDLEPDEIRQILT